MCVIVVKPSNVNLPREEILEKCWNANPDGAGFAFQLDKEIIIRKGFMDFYSLMDALEGLKKELGLKELKRKILLLHFRLASCVSISPEYTHPFPLSSSLDDLMQTEIKTKVAIAHNGVFYGMGNAVISDTQDFILSVLIPLKNRIYEKNILRLIGRGLGKNKLAMLFTSKDKRGRIELLGHFQMKDKYFFSNLTWSY